MQTSLRGIANKAKQQKNYRFGDLYRLLDKNALYLAWKEINKKAAVGVDKETAKEFEKNLDDNLNVLLDALKSKRYKAKLVKRVNIPKGEGKTRPLGIPALRDKIVQRAVASILEAIYEQDFLKCSYGYRPKIGAKTAVKELTKEVQGKYSYIVEADIQGFFNNINHDWLMEMLKQRIKDGAFLRLIKKWLKAGILETDGAIIHPITGCPQGGLCKALHNPPYALYSAQYIRKSLY